MAGKSMIARERNGEFVEALARGLDVIQAFGADKPEMTLSEIAQATGLSPATVRRSLLTLYELGYVAMHGKRYLLSAKVLTLGAAFLNSMNLKDVADGFLQSVADRFHEAASLAVLEDADVLYISHISSDRNIRFKARVGYRLPAYGTSLGHVLLAYRDPGFVESYLRRAPFEAYTARTTVTRADLLRCLADVREKGYAAVQDQLEYGVVAVAVPVRDGKGRVVAAINCSSQIGKVDLPTMIKTRVPLLTEAAAQIGTALERFPAVAHSVFGHR